MAQWTNLNQNNSFVNLPQLPLLCEKSGAVHLAGLISGWLADKIQVNFKIFKYDNLKIKKL